MEIKDCIIPSRGQSPFIDLQLPKHAYKTFPKRAISDIVATSIHQTAAASTLIGIAYYHSSADNHICKDGCPGICYHFAIDYDGVIYQVNDLTDVVYSSGKKKSYRADSQANCFANKGKHFNNYSIGVLVRGSFDGPGFKGGQDPTPAQMEALKHFALWSTQIASFADNKPIELRNFLGHCHVNKKACPGFIIQEWIEKDIWTGKFLEKIEDTAAIEPTIELTHEQAMIRDRIKMLKAASGFFPMGPVGIATGSLVGAGSNILKKTWQNPTEEGALGKLLEGLSLFSGINRE